MDPTDKVIETEIHVFTLLANKAIEKIKLVNNETAPEKMSSEIAPLLQRIENRLSFKGYSQIYFLLVNNQFYIELGKIDHSKVSIEIFDLQTQLFKALISFVRNCGAIDDEFQKNLGLTLTVYLRSFQEYQFLVSYQISYLHRLLMNIVDIFGKFPRIWFRSRSENKDFVMFDLFKRLIFKDGVEPLANDFLKLISIGHSNKLYECWLLVESNIVKFLVEKFLQGAELQIAHSAAPAKFDFLISYFFKVLSSCSQNVKAVMCEKFQKEIFADLLDSQPNDVLTSFVFRIVQEVSQYENTDDLLGKMISSSSFGQYLIQVIHLNMLDSNNVLILSELLSNHDVAVVVLFGSKTSESLAIEEYPINYLRVKAMKLDVESTIDVKDTYLRVLKSENTNFNYYAFNGSTNLSKFYLKSLLYFFENDNDQNESLIELTKTLVMKSDLIQVQSFIAIIEYLDMCCNCYLKLSKQNSDAKFNTLELDKMSKIEYLQPNFDSLQLPSSTYIRDNSKKYIDYTDLMEKFPQFARLMIEIYVISKIKNMLISRK